MGCIGIDDQLDVRDEGKQGVKNDRRIFGWVIENLILVILSLGGH